MSLFAQSKGTTRSRILRAFRSEGGYRVYIERLFLIKFSNFFSKAPLFLYYHWSKPAVFDNSLSSPDPKNQILYEMVKTKGGFWHFWNCFDWFLTTLINKNSDPVCSLHAAASKILRLAGILRRFDYKIVWYYLKGT